MQFRSLGRTGLSVSAIGFGGAPIGIPEYLSHEDRDSEAFQISAIQAIREAVDLGINYFDTAPGYGDGRSERLLGAGLEGRRDNVVLATKHLFRLGQTWGDRTIELKQSLARLRTSWVDVLQLHGSVWDSASASGLLRSDILDWMESVREAGLVRCIGITAEAPSGGLERLLESGRFDLLEIAYNFIYQASCDYQRQPTGVIPLAKSLGVAVTTMRPTTCGVLQKLLSLEFDQIDRDRITELAIRFVLSTPEVDCVIVGMRDKQEVQRNARLVDMDPIDLRWLHDRFDESRGRP